MKFDIAIIGAGIVGAACAFSLSNEGFKVVVIEANEIASGTTAAGMGHIVLMDDSEAQFALTNYSQNLWTVLAERLPKDCEYENCGTIWVAADEKEMQEALRKKDYFESRDVRAEILDSKSLREAEPNLRESLIGGLLIPKDSVVYQLRATHFLLEKAKEFGTKVVTGKRVIEISNDVVKFGRDDSIAAEKIINAAGFWSKELVPDLEIVKRKGHLVITERYPDFIRHQLIELGYLKSAHSSDKESVAFNVQPRMTDQVLIGSSRQFGTGDKKIDYNILRKMIHRAFDYMPNLKNLLATRVWTGFRPTTPDNLPYIGRHPSLKNVYLATGHEGLGITTSLGTAELLKDEILGRKSKIDRTPYSPTRMN